MPRKKIFFASIIGLSLLLSGCVSQDSGGLFPAAGPAEGLQQAGGTAAPETTVPAAAGEGMATGTPALGDIISCTITGSRIGYYGFDRWPYHYFTITYTNLTGQAAANVQTQINNPTEIGEDVVNSWESKLVGDIPARGTVSVNYGVNVRMFHSSELRSETKVITTAENGNASTCNLILKVPK